MEHVFRGRGVSQRQGVGLSGVALGQALQAGLGALQGGRRGFLAARIRCLCKRPVAELKF